MFSELVTTVLGYKTLGVDEVEFALGFLYREAAAGVVFKHLLGDTYTCAACAHEDELLFFNRDI